MASPTILPSLQDLNVFGLLTFLPGFLILSYVLSYIVDPHGIRSIPGPFLAKFSDFWLGWISGHGHRSEVVHELHQKYGMSDGIHEQWDLRINTLVGTFVRIAPNHVSIDDPEALGIVYAHGNGSMKSDFYDAFVSIQRGLFNTRNRADHARKRKIVSHIFSQKNVIEFEPHVRQYVGELIQQWDRLYESATKGLSGNEGEGGWTGRAGRLWLDCLPCE